MATKMRFTVEQYAKDSHARLRKEENELVKELREHDTWQRDCDKKIVKFGIVPDFGVVRVKNKSGEVCEYHVHSDYCISYAPKKRAPKRSPNENT